MNEYQRQAYLSTLGVENYMPRWRLTLAPEPVVCLLPMFIQMGSESDLTGVRDASAAALKVAPDDHRHVSESPLPVAEVLRGLTLEKKPDIHIGTVATPVPVPHIEQPGIPAFALSIWRPRLDLLVIDSRNTRLALPTDLLLNNILRTLFDIQSLGEEEILHWPMVDNAFVSRTFDDAKGALQVWLEVELELRPARKILLMGKNAAQYFLSNEADYTKHLCKTTVLDVGDTTAAILPSLIEILQQPLLKRDVWRLLQSWRDLA